MVDFTRSFGMADARDVPLNASFASGASLPSFNIAEVDLKFPIFQREGNNLSFPLSVDVRNPPIQSGCPALASCCTCFQMSPVLNEGDGRWVGYSHEVEKLDFLNQYHLAPGYTRESLAPQMEYMGPLKDRLAELRARYQRNYTPIATEIHKKKQSPTGLSEVTSKFEQYSKDLLIAGQNVGFRHRDENYAQLNMSVNLISSRFREEVEALIGKPSSIDASVQTKQLHDFFIKEPWDTQCKYLIDGIIRVQKGITGAKMGSALTSLANGVGETPSFYITYDDLYDPQVQAAVDRLVKEFRHSTMLVYELRLVFNANTNDSADTICAKVLPLFQALASGDVKIELLRICGTLNVVGEMMGDHEKVVTRVLKTLAGGTGKCMSTLERLDLSRNYVDFETLKFLAELMTTCSCTAINLSHWKLGLFLWPEVVQVPVRNGTCADCTNMCCFTHGGDRERCQAACCICFNKVIDNAQLSADIHSAQIRYREKNNALLGHHQGGHYMRQIFKNMQVRPTASGDQFKLDIVDMSHTNLAEFCGGAENVAKLLSVLGDCRPTAVNLVESGLTDLHAYGLSQLFCKNPFMIHFSASMCSSDLESIETLQNLIQNNPILVSGHLSYSHPSNCRVHHPVVPLKGETNYCCCTGQPCGSFLFYPCCLKVTTQKHVQDHTAFTVPMHPLTLEDFDEYKTAMERAIHEHRVLPLLTLLMKFANSERKTHKLTHAAIDRNYSAVLSQKADEKKLSLFRAFSKSVGAGFGLEKQLEQMCERIKDRVAEHNAVTDQIREGHNLALEYVSGGTEALAKYEAGEKHWYRS
mmetsp:Transcript_9250/g.14920  ORF Transcript_9250/g.14920 Transcript_9250/m.14920 type:complete len:811 (+) Transcript_9250:54-2486(+)